MKTCSKCKETNDNFNKGQSYCRTCQAEYKKRYKEKNQEKLREQERNRMREKRQDPLYRKKEYKNRDKSLFVNYAKNRNPDDSRKWGIQSTHRARAKRAGLKYDLTYQEWEETKAFFNHSCAYCGATKELWRDHIVPHSKEGGYTKWNIVPCCRTCNTKKQDQNWLEWYKNQPFFDSVKKEKIGEYYDKNKFNAHL